MTEKEEKIRLLVGGSWYNELKDEFDKEYMTKINETLQQDLYYPDRSHIFRAFMMCPFVETKIVILGQDPYHDGQANGLCFSTKNKLNPSLRKLLDALDDDIKFGQYLEYQNDLSYLCAKGVLLLNAALTVKPGTPRSHTEMWKPFTEAVFKALNEKDSPVVFLLWGKDAQYYKRYIDPFKHKVIECEHPAAAAYNRRPWKHNECFSEAQAFVIEHYGERYGQIW